MWTRKQFYLFIPLMFRHVYENMYIYRYIYYIYIYIYRSRIVVVCRIYTTFDVNIAILKLKPKPSKIFGVATFTDKFMALILDGIPEIDAYVGNNLCYLICLRHLIRSGEVTNRDFFTEKTYSPSHVRNMCWITI